VRHGIGPPAADQAGLRGGGRRTTLSRNTSGRQLIAEPLGSPGAGSPRAGEDGPNWKARPRNVALGAGANGFARRASTAGGSVRDGASVERVPRTPAARRLVGTGADEAVAPHPTTESFFHGLALSVPCARRSKSGTGTVRIRKPLNSFVDCGDLSLSLSLGIPLA